MKNKYIIITLLTIVLGLSGCDLKEMFKFDLLPNAKEIKGIDSTVKDVFSPLKETFKGSTFKNEPHINQRDVITNKNTIIRAGKVVNGLNPIYLLISMLILTLIIFKLNRSKNNNNIALESIMRSIEKADSKAIKNDVKMQCLKHGNISKVIEPIVYKINKSKYIGK